MLNDAIIKDCREKEFYLYGTHKIFDRRAYKLHLYRSWITFLGIAGPLAVGAAVLAPDIDLKKSPVALMFIGVLGGAQLLLSAFSLVFRWDEKYQYSLDSSRENNELCNKFKSLNDGQTPGLEVKYNELVSDNSKRESKDLGQGVTNREKKFGYRESLHHYGLRCRECQKTKARWKLFGCRTCGRHLTKGN